MFWVLSFVHSNSILNNATRSVTSEQGFTLYRSTVQQSPMYIQQHTVASDTHVYWCKDDTHPIVTTPPTHMLGSDKWRVFVCSRGCPISRVANAWCRTSWVTWGTAPPRVYVRHMGVSRTIPFFSISLPHRTPTLFTDSSTNSITDAIYESYATHRTKHDLPSTCMGECYGTIPDPFDRRREETKEEIPETKREGWLRVVCMHILWIC